MITLKQFKNLSIFRSKSTPILGYLALLSLFSFITICSIMNIGEKLQRRATSYEALQRIERLAKSHIGQSEPTSDAWPPGSPFLEGETINLAGAALLQQITSAIIRAGGTVVSSELPVQSAEAKNGYVSALTNCEIEQSKLQQLLYELESRMPFLFVEQLTIQAPTSSIEGERLRVLIGISAMWPGST